MTTSPYGQRLREIASHYDRQDGAMQRLAFCFDVYLQHVRNGAEPTRFLDGSIAMDSEKATAQLENAIRSVLGLPEDT